MNELVTIAEAAASQEVKRKSQSLLTMEELLQTQSNYYKQLGIFVTEGIPLLRKILEKTMDKKDLKKMEDLFKLYDDLYKANDHFSLLKVEELSEENLHDFIDKLYAVVITANMFGKAIFPYMIAISVSLEENKDIIKAATDILASPDNKKFLNTFNFSYLSDKPVETYFRDSLMAPVQRMMRYHMTLGELRKKISDDHLGKSKIDEIIKKFSELNSFANEAPRSIQDAQMRSSPQAYRQKDALLAAKDNRNPRVIEMLARLLAICDHYCHSSKNNKSKPGKWLLIAEELIQYVFARYTHPEVASTADIAAAVCTCIFNINADKISGKNSRLAYWLSAFLNEYDLSSPSVSKAQSPDDAYEKIFDKKTYLFKDNVRSDLSVMDCYIQEYFIKKIIAIVCYNKKKSPQNLFLFSKSSNNSIEDKIFIVLDRMKKLSPSERKEEILKLPEAERNISCLMLKLIDDELRKAGGNSSKKIDTARQYLLGIISATQKLDCQSVVDKKKEKLVDLPIFEIESNKLSI